MRAIVVRLTPQGIELVREEIGEAVRSRDDEVLIDVELASMESGPRMLNPARVADRVVGRGFAGRVLAGAADGSGPATGDRVIGIAPGGSWRERLVARVSAIARVPDTLELDEAVRLPVPGFAAYSALRPVGFAFGKRLLVLGAETATGQYVVQLGLVSGMRVTGLVERAAHVRAVRSHGVEEVAVWGRGPGAPGDASPDIDLVVDASAGRCPDGGGAELAPDGLCVSLSIDESGHVAACRAFESVAPGDPRHRHVATGDPRAFDAIPPPGQVLERLVDALARGEIVLPLALDERGTDGPAVGGVAHLSAVLEGAVR